MTDCGPISKLNGKHEYVPLCSSGFEFGSVLFLVKHVGLSLSWPIPLYPPPPLARSGLRDSDKYLPLYRSAASVVQPRRFPRRWVACPGDTAYRGACVRLCDQRRAPSPF
ncbi:hypothetical protein CGRA01v4_11429 [Colletotrichum graminicola]|nr:hypothetical protein CGRA01v4_11429 [Colletotrichum graminicola]